MAVTNNFAASTLDLNGQVSLSQPTALVWGPDGRLYVTEVDGDVKVLTVAFGDKNLADGDATANFYVASSVTLSLIKGAVQNHNDDGSLNASANRQVTGIDVTQQFDANGDPVLINGKPAVTMYVTSSDSRIGAGGGGNDANLDTNSGVITMLTQTGPDSWTAIDIVRGLPRSEENHATNGLEVIQDLDANGKLVSERLIVASGGNANTGAPSNNFAGQQEQPLSAAILEVDLTMLKAMPVLNDAGRAYIYDIPTLNDPSRTDANGSDVNDPFGGNDGRNSAKLLADGPISIYSPGYRNAYDVEVTEDGRVWTYDNGANNSWGGRPIGEAGDNGNAIDIAQALGYIATNLNNGEGNASDDINLVNWDPSNKDNFHEVTRSDDLAGRALSAGQGGATTFEHEGLTYVYGGHPNPTRAEGSRAGLLFSPDSGTDNAFLLVSNVDSYGNGGGSDYVEVIAWLTEVENNNTAFPTSGIFGAEPGALTKKVLSVTPGVLYDIYSFADGSGAAVVAGSAAPNGGTLQGQAGLPADIAEIVAYKNPIEGDYKEAGKTDGALDSGNGSINGLAEYTSTILDAGSVKMSGAILATQLNGGNIIAMGRNADGSLSSVVTGGFATAADRTVIAAGGSPLGIATIGDDFIERGLTQPFQGSIWTAVFGQNGPLIEVLQPNNGAVPLAGSEILNPTDRDLDGIDYVADPFEFSDDNGFAIAPGQKIVLDFAPLNTNFPTSLSSTGLLGAALDGVTPNRDAQTAFENFPVDQQFDGLYDIGGNVLPGGNAPILQIKKVIAGSVVGAANTARDVLHTGVLPSADTDRLVATMTLKNWIPAQTELAVGQLTGMIFGDGTQENFLRLVFGSVPDGPGGLTAGFEVGYEIGDANYTVLETIAVPALSNVAVSELDLRLTINILDGFAVGAAYRLEGQTDFTALDLGGFVLPVGVLRDVLTGDHTIGTGATEQTSGAAFGFLAETSAGNDLDAIDFDELSIEAFGNEINANTAAEVGSPGSDAVDTVLYTGTEVALAPLAANVENFDGTASAANYIVTGNALANVIRVGSGTNTVTTGAGEDEVRGTLSQLAGDEITDFSADDKVVIEGATLAGINVTYASGSAILSINGQAITFSGPGFATFQPADGPSTFGFTETDDGVEIALIQPETVLYRVNAGSSAAGVGSGTIAAIDGGPAWIGDADLIDATGPISLTGATVNTYTQALTNEQAEIEEGNVDLSVVPWQLFVNERSDNTTAAPKLTYNFDVEVGKTYNITLYYTENWNGIFGFADSNGGNTRQFDVTVEGQQLAPFQNINPMAETLALLGQPLPAGSDSDAAKQPFLGVAFERTLTYTATDELLTLEWEHEIENPKVNAIQISVLGGPAQPPADTTAPVIESITVSNPPSVQDGPRTATVVLSDETGFAPGDFAGLTGAELTFTGIVPAAVSAPTVVLSPDNKLATLTYTLTPPAGSNAWPTGSGQVAIAAGAYDDAAGNDSPAAQATFILQPNVAQLVRGDVVAAFNAGGPALTFEGINFAAATSGTTGVFAGGEAFTDSTGGNGLQPVFDGTIYQTEINSAANGDGSDGIFTFSAPVDPTKLYFVDLYMAEIYTDDIGGRVFDVFVEGSSVPVIDNLDIVALTGSSDTPIRLQLAEPIAPGANGAIDLSFVTVTDRAKVSAIAIREAILSGEIAIANAPTLVEAGDVGVTTLAFPLTLSGPDATVTLDFTVGGIAQTPVVVTFVNGAATLSVPVANDAADNGPDAVTVVLTGASSGFSVVPSAGTATGTVTEDDIADPADIDGDGILNAVDPAAFDATNGAPGVALNALAQGGRIEFNFDTPTSNVFDGSTGLSGVMTTVSVTPPVSASDPYGILTNEATTSVTADGFLSVDSSGNDTFTIGSNATQNAGQDLYQVVVDVTANDRVRFETKFKNPFDTEPTSFSSLGLQIGSGDQDNYVKFVFGGNNGTGNGASRFQIGNNNALQSTATNTANLGDQNLSLSSAIPLSSVSGLTDIDANGGINYNDLLQFTDSIKLALEVDRSTAPQMTLKGFWEFFDVNGNLIASGTLPANGSSLLVKNGSELEASLLGQNPNFNGEGGVAFGVIHTDWDSNPLVDTDTFNAQFDYLHVVSLDEAPNQAPTIDAGIADETTAEDAPFSFAVPTDAFADDAGAANLVLTSTLANGDPLPGWLSFANGVFSGTPPQDFNGTVSVEVTATDAGGLAAVDTFDLVVTPVNDDPTGTVTITGTATQGETLVASNDLADADGIGTIAYQWFADGVAIDGAIGDTLVLGQAEVGKAITVVASYTDGGDTAETVGSAATPTVANVNDVPTGTVTITGTATQGETLTAANTLADADGLGAIAYQWFADDVAIDGATGGTLVLTQAEVDKVITVVASYTDLGGTPESVTSAATPPVIDVIENAAPTAVTVTPVLTQVAENASTAAAIKVADIAVTDDGLGTNVLTLVGADAGLFEIVGTELRLKAGTVLDFETNPSLDVNVQVDDATIGATPDASAAFTLAVTDLAELASDLISFGRVQLAPGVTPSTAQNELGTDDVGGTTAIVNRATVALVGDGDQLLEADESAFVLGGAASGSKIAGLGSLNTSDDPVILSAHGRTSTSTLGTLSAQTAITFDPAWGFGVQNSTEAGGRLMSYGDSVTWTLPDVGTVSQRLTSAQFTIDTNGSTNTTEIAIDFDGDVVTSGSATIAQIQSRADAALRLAAKNNDVIAINFEAQSISLNGITQSGAAIDGFFDAFELSSKNLLTLGGIGVVGLSVENLVLGTFVENAAPTEVVLANVVTTLVEGPLQERVKVADIQVIDDGVGTFVLTLVGADAGLFEIDGTELFLKAGVTLDFATKPQLDVTVEVDDPTLGGTPDATADLTVEVTEVGANEAPSEVVLSNVLNTLAEGTLTAATKVADIAVIDDGLGTNVLSLTGDDAALFEINGSALFLKAGTVLDFETNASLDVTVAVDDAAVGGAPDATADVTLSVTDVDEPVANQFAPDGDLDGDTILNSVDPDVDGDDTPNVNDAFAYDAANGMTLTAGEVKLFDFSIDGTIYQNGITGFLQGTTNGGNFNEDTGAASVSGGVLTVNPVTSGDTGGTNNPQDDAVVGVKNGTFIAKAVVLNPWVGTAPNPTGFDQLGLVMGLDSANMIKLVFGQTAGVVEFQKQENDVGTKFGGTNPVAGGNANVALPAGVTLDSFAKAEIIFEVASTSAAAATVTGTIVFQDASGTEIARLELPAAPIGGVLAAALADPAVGVAVGFTQANQVVGGAADVTFVAQLDSLTIIEGDGTVAPVNQAPTAVTLTNVVTGIAESTSVATKVADIVVTDDGQGTNVLALTGADAGLFEIVGTQLFLKAGQTLDATTNPTLDVAVTVDDATLGGSPDATSAAIAIPVTEVASEQVVLRINAFGPQVTATDGGPNWLADNGAGSQYLVTTDNRGDAPAAGYTGSAAAIPAGIPESVLDTARSSDAPFTYNIPVADIGGAGLFRVNLYVAELFAGGQASAFRIFDASLEGAVPVAFDNITPGTAFGANVGVLSADIQVSDGVLNIGFLQDPAGGGVQNPIVNAIEVVRISGPTADTQAPTAEITLTNPATANGPLLVSIELSDASGINQSTLGAGDIQVTVGGVVQPAANTTFTGFAGGVATYSIAPPAGGGWADGQSVAVTLLAGAVADAAPVANTNAATSATVTLDIGGGPVDPGNPQAILAALTDVDDNGSYASNVVGSAELRIMEGVNSVQSSNFGANSFEIENTGGKQIAAVFLDFREALYGDSIVDFDGSAGDTTAKVFAVNSQTGGNGSGAFFDTGETYYLPGAAPLPNNTGTGISPATGGFRGLLLKFDGTAGGFTTGEVVGFSGDMDPNSIAGLIKSSGGQGVDPGAISSWDVGGVSGAELIGSGFTVLFDDGTTASGVLGSDGSQAGSVGTAVQNRASQTATVTVNGFTEAGTYGGTVPEIVVTGPANSTVLVTMSKGLNPVTNTTNGYADLVQDRLDAAHPDFPVSNAGNFQTFEVTLGASGTATLPANAFNYNSATSGGTTFAGSAFTDAFATAPMVIAAAVVASDGTPLGAVDRVYLTNDGGPVVGGAGAPNGFFQVIGTGNSARFKVQIEDPNANGGTNPGGDWTYVAGGTGAQAGTQGTGHYFWGSESSSTGVNNPEENSFLNYTIFIPEGEGGVYNFRVRSSRDTNDPTDQRNDIWLRIDSNAEALQTNPTDSVSSQGFVKVFGAGTSWGFASQIDSVSESQANFGASFNLTAGLHTITLAGRSDGFHADYWELYKGGAPAVNAANSAFVPTGPTVPTVVTTSASIIAGNGDIEISTLPTSVLEANLTSANLEFGTDNFGSTNPAEPQKVNVVGMRFTGLEVPANADIASAFLVFEAAATSSVASSFEISIQNSLSGAAFTTSVPNFTSRTFVGDVDWVPGAWVTGQTYSSVDVSALIEQVIGTGGLDATDGLVFRITGTGVREAHSFDSTGGDAPILQINYNSTGAPALPTISIADIATAVSEGGAAQFVVSLSGPATGPVTVTYSTANGTAAAPGDFTASTSQTVT
ncbi:MAG: malectin domain-containing carbohydrate-binding protein, partial [Hyphomicrobiaceae bacterium]|nr:malectin domain-containing carbohydrate-binding protein [Hyphomicrobiaceae bacterium]